MTDQPAEPTNPVDDLAELLDVATALIGGVEATQWSAPTPCTQWDVRALVNHLVAGDRLFAALLAGDTTGFAADVLGDDPVAAHRDAAVAVLAAFRRPGVLAETVTVPFGTVPGMVALHLRLTEVLVHGWDLAQATGQVARFPDAIVARELQFTLGALASVPAERSPFAPPQPVDDAAPLLDRLAATLGRSLTGEPSGTAG